MKKAAIYARVSTGEQTPENQFNELRAVAERMGWSVEREYVDNGVSGAKSRDERPEFRNLCDSALRREVDIIMAWSVDRLGRSLQDLVGFLDDIHAKGVNLYLHQQGIDTTTASGKAMFQMCAVFAQYERSMIRERVKAGLARAKANGKVLGRPKVSADIEEAIRRERSQGKGIRRIARELGVGVSTTRRVLNSTD